MVWGVFDWPETTEAKSEEASEGDYPECDYDSNLTPLYEAIEERAWIAVNQFLHSGYWPESLFADPMSPEEQARTWVTRYETRPDGSKKVRWSQLPIHAAVIFGAPSVVIQQLVECFPQSVRCTDDHRMLPLHLAFRHGSDDSVLALFLEEFPEAVNVRGYKGRLPVECALKGPNPERGAIIQTILSKNQSVWERKKSAVQLKELYCVKEALKIKSQKVSHLETAIREIKSREHKTRKELTATMTELKAAKIKTKDHDNETSTEDKSAERNAVKALVEKLAALEMATKDLVDKEKATRKELTKTRAELENARNVKPTDDQAAQFATLEKVASKEEDKLDRAQSKSFDGHKSAATPASILKNKTEEKWEAASHASTKKSTKSRDSKVSALTADTPVTAHTPAATKSSRSVASSKSPAAPSATAASASKSVHSVASSKSPAAASASRSVASSKSPAAPSPELVLSQSRELEQQKLQETLAANQALTARIAELEQLKQQESMATNQAASEALDKRIAELEEQRKQEREAANEALTKKIAELEATIEANDEMSAQKAEELEAVSVPDKDNNFSDQQTESMAALQKEMLDLRESSQATKDELSKALRQLAELKATQDLRVAEALAQKDAADREARAHNKELEKKVAVLELSLKQFEEKSEVAKTEMQNIKENMLSDKAVKLTPAQERYMKKLEDAIVKIEKNEKKTKEELAAALSELEMMKTRELENAAVLAAAEKEKFRSVEEANKALEAKIAMLESTMKGFEDKATKTKEEMQKAMNDLMASDASVASGESLKLTKKQKQHMQALENAMKKLEDRASSTKAQLDAALSELAELKETEKLEYTRQGEEAKRDAKALKDLAKKVQALQSAMVGFEVKETRTIQELEAAMMQLAEKSNKRFEVLHDAAMKTEELVTDPRFTRDVDKLEKKAMKEEKRLAELEMAVQDIITKSGNTKEELERTQQLLAEVTATAAERPAPENKEEKEEAKQDKKLIKELTKKVATLQSAIIGFEVKETRTMKELETTMKQLEELTSKRFEVLEKAAAMKEKDTEKLAAAGALAEEKVAALHAAMQELERNAAKTHEELERTKLELGAMKQAEISNDGVNKRIITSQEGQIQELNEKISVLQQAVVGFEVKESKTMQELEQTMKQLEELTAKRFEVLQKVAGREIEAAKAAEAEKYNKKAAEEEKKVAALEFAMRELEAKAYKTKLELERTMKTLEEMEEKQHKTPEEETSISKEEKSVLRELVSKVADIQEAVMAYDEKEMKTTKKLEQTKAELEATRKEVEMLRAKTTVIAAEKKHAEEISVVSVASQSHHEAVEAVEVQDNEDASVTAKRVTEETLTSLESAIHRLVETLGEDEPSPLATRVLKAVSRDEREKPVPPIVQKAVEEAAKEAGEGNRNKVGYLKNLFEMNGAVEKGFQKAAAVQKANLAKAAAAKAAADAKAAAEKAAAEEAAAEAEEAERATAEKAAAEAEEAKRVAAEKAAPAAEQAAAAENEAAAMTYSGPHTSKPPQNLLQAAAATPPKKKRSLFGRLSVSSKGSSTSSKKESKGKRIGFGAVTLFGPKKSKEGLVVTEEQRKTVEAVHGTAIVSVLNNQQILDLLNQIEVNASQEPAIETVPSVHSSAEKSVKSTRSTHSKASVRSSGIKEQDPHMMIVSLPSQRSTASAEVPPSSSMKSQKSAKSASSPRSKAGSIAPVPSPKNMTEAKGPIVAATTYDDGFEINF